MCLAIPGKILETSMGDHSTALVDIMGVRRRVDLGLLLEDPPVANDWVLIHVGFAMSKISAVEAEDQMRLLAMLGEAQAAYEEVSGYSSDDGSPGQPNGDAHIAAT